MGASLVLPRRTALGRAALALAGAVAIVAGGRRTFAETPANDDPWPSLAGQIFADRTIHNDGTMLGIDAPYRAEDAAVVPIGIRDRRPADETEQFREITLVIDQNPSPVAAIFYPGTNSGIRFLSTRIRVDAYTKIHAVAATPDGQLYATERFVKAAGGCSAPAAKQEADSIPAGTMRFRQFPLPPGSDLREAQLMIRHPNNSGMQMDQITRLYVPAHFISSVRIWQGEDLLLRIEGGISLSENPQFRFDYRPNGATQFRAEVQDNNGGSFEKTWPSVPA